jgi:hypothetical protein
MIGVFPPIADTTQCVVRADDFKPSYTPSNKYLGINRTLPREVTLPITFNFRSLEKKREFFVFWESETSRGAKPFYCKLPLFGDFKYYLILQNGEMTQTVHPFTVSANYILYTARTLEENNPPVVIPQSFSVDMDSTNNYIHVIADDFDVLTYSIVTNPTNGVMDNIGGGAFYYTPTDGFSGIDTFVVGVTDELGVATEATVSINVINWKLSEEFTLTMDAGGHLFIDYVNPSTLDPLIIQAVDELSLGEINNNGEYMIYLTQTLHIDDIIKTADEEWLITTK